MRVDRIRKLVEQNPVYQLLKIIRKRRGWKKNTVLSITAIYLTAWFIAIFNYCGRCRISMPETAVPIGSGYCRPDLTELKLQSVNLTSEISLQAVQQENPHLLPGGSWKPSDCKPQQKVAIIIPFRNRWHHLRLLLRRLHPMLQRQLLDYQIFVIEQAGPEVFNRGLVRNVGIVEALRERHFDCFCMHDVDLIPEHDANLYYCDGEARQLSPAIDEQRYHPLYRLQLGGVAMFRRDTIYRCNGYSNLYWDWGNEDDDICARSEAAGLLLSRPPYHIGRYKMVRHVKEWRSDVQNHLFMTWRSRWQSDGLNSMNGRYKVLSRIKTPLYTNITFTATPPDFAEIRRAEAQPRESYLWFLQFYFP